YPKFPMVEIEIARYGLSFRPWADWQYAKNPNWWKSYNNVKHQRNRFFAEATMQNTLLSMSGLMCCLLYYYQRTLGNQPSLDPAPQLLQPKWYESWEPASVSRTYTSPTYEWERGTRLILYGVASSFFSHRRAGLLTTAKLRAQNGQIAGYKPMNWV